MNIRFHPFTLHLSHTFTISHSKRDSQQTLVVELTDGTHSGFGEAAATAYYGISVEGMMEALQRVKPLLVSSAELKPEEFWEKCAPLLQDNRFALCALDIAMHDLYGRKKELPLYKLWGLDISQAPLTNYTIGIDTPEKMAQKILEFPWPLYKIKLGTTEDVEIIRELRRHTNAIFRVDANGAWSVAETLANAKAFQALGVEFIEQPLPAGDLDGMKHLYTASPLPLIADESCILEEDVAKCKGHFHGINIKLPKCGGLTPALRMIREGRELGLKVMVGCMTESSVGISAIAQLLPLLDYVDMDGALLLKEDVAEGVEIRDGKVYFPERNGTGVVLK